MGLVFASTVWFWAHHVVVCVWGYGGYGERETPGSIPNPVAKLLSADGTALVTVWESRTPPDIFCVGGVGGCPSPLLGGLDGYSPRPPFVCRFCVDHLVAVCHRPPCCGGCEWPWERGVVSHPMRGLERPAGSADKGTGVTGAGREEPDEKRGAACPKRLVPDGRAPGRRNRARRTPATPRRDKDDLGPKGLPPGGVAKGRRGNGAGARTRTTYDRSAAVKNAAVKSDATGLLPRANDALGPSIAGAMAATGAAGRGLEPALIATATVRQHRERNVGTPSGPWVGSSGPDERT